MNSEIVQNGPPQRPNVFDSPSVGDGIDSDKLIEKIDQLETDLSRSRDGRREERFYWILGVSFLGNVIIMSLLGNVLAFLILLIIQLPFLAGLARYLGVDWAVEAIERALQSASEHFRFLRK